MKRIFARLGSAIFLFSTSALAQSEAYNAGYKAGRAIAQALPIIGAIVVVLAAWFGYRAWRKRQSSGE